MTAIAAACLLLAVIGGAAYYYLGASKEAPAIAASAPVVATPAASSVQTPAVQSPEPTVPKTLPNRAPASPAPLPQTKPLPAKLESVQPASADKISLPALPQNEKPSLIRESAQMASAMPGSGLDRLMPKSAPDKPNTPVAPRRVAAANVQPVVSGTVVQAVPISQISPKYPAMAVKTRASATIVLDLVIDEKGNVVDATPVSGPTLFHKEAVDAAMKWRYRPASLGGVNVKSQTRVTMSFKLK